MNIQTVIHYIYSLAADHNLQLLLAVDPMRFSLVIISAVVSAARSLNTGIEEWPPEWSVSIYLGKQLVPLKIAPEYIC